MQLRSILATAVMLSAGFAAHASSFNVSVSEGTTPNGFFDTTAGNPFSGSNTASASFIYNNAGVTPGYLLNFSNTAAQNQNGSLGDLNSTFGFSTTNISGYSGSGTVTYNGTQVANYTSLAGFLASSGSSGNPSFGSYYLFSLNGLSAGTTLTITHDDGVSLYLGNTRIDNFSSGTLSSTGATAATTDKILLTQSGNYSLRYARENGSPSILQVSAQTPEPSSIALLGTGFLGIAGAARRRFRKSNA